MSLEKVPFKIGKFMSLVLTRVVFFVRRVENLMKTAKVNAYIMYIFGKIELLSIHATLKTKMHYFHDFQEAKTCLYIGQWKYGRNMTFMD